MKLNLDTIKSITTGAVRVEETDGHFNFFRFTKEQEDYYEDVSRRQERSFYDRCHTTAGVRLMFKTDSKSLKLKGFNEYKTSRTYFSFDIFVNGEILGHIDNFKKEDLPVDYTTTKLPLGDFEKEFALPSGTNDITIYFPWSAKPTICEISIDDGAFITPIKRDKKLLAFGDSITQGYDALRPSLRYVSLLADKLGVEEINKGIGGEFYVPELAKIREDYTPDFITVAYGTNDWGNNTEDEFKIKCREFYKWLNCYYKRSKIFAISPIWRADYQGEREFGPFLKVEKDIKEAVSDFDNIIFISGFDLVPQHEKYFADLRVHPNDEGFKHYADNLYNKIIKYI